MDFERWFAERTRRFERVLITGAAGLLILLVVSQALLTQPGLRRFLSLVDRLEGVRYEGIEQTSSPRPADFRERFLELSIVSGEGTGLEVLVNGEVKAVFGKSKTVRFPVRDGDDVVIAGRQTDEDVVIEVTGGSADLATPAMGRRVTYFGANAPVSYVTVR